MANMRYPTWPWERVATWPELIEPWPSGTPTDDFLSGGESYALANRQLGRVLRVRRLYRRWANKHPSARLFTYNEYGFPVLIEASLIP